MLNRILLLIAIVLSFWACQSKKPTQPSKKDEVPIRIIKGSINTGNQDLIDELNLQITHYLGNYSLKNNNFQIDLYKSAKQQILFVTDSQYKLYLMGIVDTTDNSIKINANSTAKALALMVPFSLGTTYETRRLFLQSVEQDAVFNQLVNAIQKNLDEGKSLSLEEQPEVFQMAFLLAQKIYEQLLGQNKIERLGNDGPWIEGHVPIMVFKNPKCVYYGAGIYYVDNGNEIDWDNPDKTALIEAKSGLFDIFHLFAEPAETDVEVETHTRYFVILNKGMGIGLNLDIWTSDLPQGIGARANIGQAILYIADLIPGAIIPAKVDFGGLADISIDAKDLYQLSQAISQGNSWNFLTTVAGIVSDNAQGIGLWLWEQGVQGASSSSEFWETLGNVAGDLSKIGTLLTVGNEVTPYLNDLLTAPNILYYSICVSNNAFVECGTLKAPVANFTITPPAGDVGTIFLLDASNSYDDQTPVEKLEVRWDINADGVFETDWSRNKTYHVSFNHRGIKKIYLEVRDEQGLVSNVTRQLNVSGGYASGKHIVIFRDVLPWSNIRIEDQLVKYGYTEGNGSGQYSIHTSSEMGTVSLQPGYDFVIISNSQDQNFYNTYAQWNARFSDFVYNGGSMFWEACDNGWYNNDPVNNAGGSMSTAGVIIPGNISTSFKLDSYNYLTQINSPLTAGLQDTLFGMFASHESFSSLPQDAVIYTVNTLGEPTLVEYHFGDGFVLVTGQPLEHGYYYGYPIGDLFYRVVAYVLGEKITGKIVPLNNKRTDIPASLNPKLRNLSQVIR